MGKGEFLQTAYVIHRRNYRESSAILEIFTRNQGRISAISRGLRRSGKSLVKSALLQPFAPVAISWMGKSDILNLTGCEPRGRPHALSDRSLVSGFYLNELLYRLIHKSDPHQDLFDYYQFTLEQLEQGGNLDSILRKFELKLLDEIGYGLNLDYDVTDGSDLDTEVQYWYTADLGAFRAPVATAQQVGVRGRTLIELREGALDDNNSTAAKDARDFMRFILSYHLGGRALKSRELFGGSK